jgi:hypothetical protein
MGEGQPASGRVRYGAWTISILAVVALLAGLAPEFLKFYACPDWGLKNNPVCSLGGVDVGWLMSLGSLGFMLLMGFAIFVAPLLLVALVIFSYVRDRK